MVFAVANIVLVLQGAQRRFYFVVSAVMVLWGSAEWKWIRIPFMFMVYSQGRFMCTQVVTASSAHLHND